nr:uncharacterized protein LOC111414979 [Onthophagus taurus]
MEEKFAINTIKYLYSLDDFVKNNVEVKNQLRQCLLQKARMLELQKNISLPKKGLNSKLKCPKCCMPRDQGYGSYKLCKNKISKFQKKMIKKSEAGGILTKYQEKYLKKHKNQTSQIIEINCRICGYKVVKSVDKPHLIKSNKDNKEISVIKKQNLQKPKIDLSSNIIKNNKQSSKQKLKQQKVELHQNPSKNRKSNANKLNKMNILLSSTSKIKNTGLKDFIKSIT